MTLDTRILIDDPVDVKELFFEGRRLLGATDRHPWKDEDDSKWRGEGVRTISNNCGIGLPAWLMIHYRDGEALRAERTCDDDCEPDCSSSYCEAAYCEWSMDTAYGYHGPNGEGCADLHARLLFEVGQWLDERGIGWRWVNEYNGDIHPGGPDNYGSLKELVRGGKEGNAWFNSVVVPAIPALAVNTKDSQ